MKSIINNFINFIKSLNFMDVLFLVAIVGLLILVVCLIYIIKLNNDDIDVEDYEDDELENTDEELDLVSISKQIEENQSTPINLNDYEKEQEEKAVISYDELLAMQDNSEISYKKEEDIDGFKIKSVDTNFLTKPIKITTDKIVKPKKVDDKKSSVLISYDKEEAFLETLKKLQKMLN